jgi:nucleotide-binding universal stress UspA family protein
VFSNIVVGTDGSKTAGRAVEVAADLARQHGAVLHLVNAYKLPSASAAAGMAGPTAIGTDDLSAETFVQESQRVLANACTTTGAAKTESHSGMGSPVDVVIGVAEAVDADLIVVGSKGMQGARRLIGSVPNSIAHRAPCHVLIAKTA